MKVKTETTVTLSMQKEEAIEIVKVLESVDFEAISSDEKTILQAIHALYIAIPELTNE